jgi:hypothetical protein
VQHKGVSSRRAHHLENISSISEEEKDSRKRDFWVFFVWPRVPSLDYSRGDFSIILFIRA